MRAAVADPLEEQATRAHDLALREPEAYARRIVFRALTGAVILHSVTVLGLLGGAALVAAALEFELPALGVVGMVAFTIGGLWLYNLFRSFDHAYGVRLDAATAPALFELLATVARQAGAPMPTRVELVPEFNAWVQVRQRPYGEWRIALGLPLMLATEVADFTAIVGHELGHFAAGTFGARLVWAQQSGWLNTFELLRSSKLASLVRGAFRSWGLRFGAEAVAMARRHELSSDQMGAAVAGASAAATGLIRIELLERAMSERFWPQLWHRVSAGDPPPEDVFVDLRHFLSSLDRADVDRYFRSAMLEQTLAFDVHPSLTDRLKSLGQRAVLPAPIARSAAAELFGPKLDEVSVSLGRWWAREVRRDWELGVEDAKQLRERVEADGKRAPTELHPLDALELARGLRLAGRVSEALPFYRRAAELNHDDSQSRLAYGLALLEVGDARGLTELGAGVAFSQGDREALELAFTGARKFLEARGEPQKNPFTAAFHRLRLNEGRRRALHEWSRPAAW